MFASEAQNQEQVLNSIEQKQILMDALKELKTNEALVLQLYYIEEFNVYDIAKVLGVSVGRVSQLKSTAFKSLKNYLMAQGILQ